MNRLPNAEQEAYEYILGKIRDGSLCAGQRLIAEDIATAIQVSRMPVRVAFRRLADEGLVDLRQNRGATVRGVDLEEVREVFEMRAVLEGHVFKIAVEQMTVDEVFHVEMLFDRMQRSIGDAEKWVIDHREFHEYLAKIAGRKRFIQQISVLHSFVEPNMRHWIKDIMSKRGIEDDHKSIMEVIRTRNVKDAAQLMGVHIMDTVNYLEGVMK